MKVSSLDDFRKHYDRYPLIPVFAEILGDFDTPVSTFLKCTEGPYRFLYESVERGENLARYSILGASPLLTFQVKDGVSRVENLVTGEKQEFVENPMEVMKRIIEAYRHPLMTDVPFSNGGLFGYLGYDTIRYIEKLPDSTVDDIGLPDIHLFIPGMVIVFDNLLHKIDIITFVIPNGDMERDYNKALIVLNQIVAKIQDEKLSPTRPTARRSHGAFESNFEQEQFEGIVLRAKEHIKRGDIFQVVLSQRLKVETQADPFDIYRALRVINPSPYMFYLEMEDTKVLGSSPETLIKLDNGRVMVKPIAGTRKRGSNDDEDRRRSEELLADPKERAEHTMLVDLGRNDIGRIAEFGTVQVEKLMDIEKYSHVIHIVSTVSGKLRQGMDSVDVFKAGFPAGTVSGAPKVRAMEIIDDLEPTRRAIYAGAVGYFSFDGNMDVCIAIRTIYMRGRTAFLQAGAGIVADSIPRNEYEETLNKARGLLKAIEYAEGGL